MYNIEFVVNLSNNKLHFESKNAEIWKEIFKVLNKHHMKINDPLKLEDYITSSEDVTDFINSVKTILKVGKNLF